MLRGLSLVSRFFDEDFDTLFQELQDTRTKKENKSQKTIYYKNGMIHNENGPAVIHKDGKESEYWLEGRKVTKQEVDEYRQNVEDNTKHCVYVADKTYIINGKQLKTLKSMLEDMTKVT